MPYTWKPDTWYRMKLQVENLPDGKVRARGKVWPVAEAEPAAWMIERIDPIPNRQGHREFLATPWRKSILTISRCMRISRQESGVGGQ